MIEINSQPAKPLNPVLAGIYGAIVALGCAYALSYVFAHFGLGVLGAYEAEQAPLASRDSEVFRRAALNLYAAQHVTLWGSGGIAGSVGDAFPGRLFASLTLPITLWTIIPVMALLLAGYVVAASRRDTSRWGMLLPAMSGGLLYALVLAALSGVVRAKIGSFAMPEIGGFSANPPSLTFRPEVTSVLVFGCGFGLLFTYIGGLIAVRSNERNYQPGKWWTSAKATILAALIVQVLMLAMAFVWLALGSRRADDRVESGRIVEMIPSAIGIAYVMANGAVLQADLESRVRFEQHIQKTIGARMSLYKGIVEEERGKVSRKPAPLRVTIPVAILTAIGFAFAGWLAVRWGARGGSLPTAGRIAIIHTFYLVVLAVLCSMELVQSDSLTTATIIIRPMIDRWIFCSFAAVFVLSMIGTYLASRRVVSFRAHSI
jgi:hypothetical protein